MDDSDYKALLIAGNLARYKGGAFIIQADERKSFLVGHHLFFMDLPSDQRAFNGSSPPPNQFSQTSTTEISAGHRACYCARAH